MNGTELNNLSSPKSLKTEDVSCLWCRGNGCGSCKYTGKVTYIRESIPIGGIQLYHDPVMQEATRIATAHADRMYPDRISKEWKIAFEKEKHRQYYLMVTPPRN